MLKLLKLLFTGDELEPITFPCFKQVVWRRYLADQSADKDIGIKYESHAPTLSLRRLSLPFLHRSRG